MMRVAAAAASLPEREFAVVPSRRRVSQLDFMCDDEKTRRLSHSEPDYNCQTTVLEQHQAL
jgi:hypothetical protein